MVKKVKGGWVVKSHKTGKKLSRKYKTKAAASRRLRQIQYFKNKKK